MSFTEWLKTPALDRCYLIEMDYLLSGTEYTLRRSTHPYRTSASDAPALTPYPDTILTLPEFDREMSEAFIGVSRVAIGELELFLDDELQSLIGSGVFGGREFRMYVGDASWPLADFGQIVVGRIERMEAASYDNAKLTFRDRAALFDRPVQQNILTTGPSAGRPIPLCYGQCFNVSPVLIDHTTKKYQVHDGAVQAVTDVRENGLSIPYTADVATGTFTLTNNATGRVTADVEGAVVDGVYLQHANQLMPELAKHALANEAENTTVIQNFTLQSEGLNQPGWVIGHFEPVVDSGVPTPTVNGESFGNYWSIVPNTNDSAHNFSQETDIPAGNWKVTYLARANGYGWLTFVLYDETLTNIDNNDRINLSGGEIVGDNLTAVDVGDGDWLVTYTAPENTQIGRILFQVRSDVNPNSSSFVGNGTDGILMTRVQLSAPNARYAKTTSTAVDTLSVNVIGDTLPSYTLGLFIDDDKSIASALDDVAASVGAAWFFNRLNQLALVHFDGVKATTDALTPDDIEDESLLPVRRVSPAKTITLGYQRNWTPQADGLAGTIREDYPETAALYEQAESVVVSTNAGISINYPDAADITVSTLIATETDAGTEAARRAAIASSPHTVFELDAFASPFAMQLGQSISIEYPQYFADGGDALITRLTDLPEQNSVRLEVWQ